MKQISLFIVALFFLSRTSVAQKDTIFINDNQKECKKNKATFYRLITKQGKEFLVKEFYLNHEPKTIAICSAVKPELIFNGKYRSYYYDSSGLNIYEGYYNENGLSGLGML